MQRKDIVKAVRRAYDSLRPFSDASRWEFWNHVAHIEEIVKIAKKGDSIIDVGSYIGIQAIALRILGYKADGNDKFVFYAKGIGAHGNAYGFTEAELQDLKAVWNSYDLTITAYDATTDTPEKQYDIAVNVAVIEHQPYPKEFIDGLMRFVKKDGYLYIATPNATKLQNRIRFLLGRPVINNIEEYYLNERDFNGHWREYTVGEVATMGHLSGLKIITAKNKQTEPVNFRLNRPGKWARSLFRLIGFMISAFGDSVIVTFKK